MSGDVQPRKRKDKKKKKEGSSLGNIHEPIPSQKFKGRSFDEDSEPTPVIGSVDPGEKIHVHNDHGIGGNICVKIIFFCLLGALVAAVGIIFIHSRGSTDVDLPSVEDSRFADYFTGWLDDATDDHGHDEHELAHGDDDGHDEEEYEHGGEEDEHSVEEETEKSEEEDHGGDAAEEASPEAEDNEEENNDDDDEEEEDEDEKPIDEDDEEEPKFKVIHRFKHFFNMRKKELVTDKSEESGVRKKRKMIEVEEDERSGEEEDQEDEEEDEEEEEKEKNIKSAIRRSRRETEKREREHVGKRSRKEVEAVEEEEEEDEDEDEEEEEEIEKEDEEEESGEAEMKVERDENDEESDERVAETEEDEDEDDDEEEKSEEKIEEIDEDDDEEEEKDEEISVEKENEEDRTDDGSREKEDEEEEEEEDEDERETDDGSPEKEDDSEEGEEENRSSEADLGLDEIDESEEALKEEDRFERGEEPSSPEKDQEEGVDHDRKDDVKDEEVEEVESKIIDIEEKLNQILREKRKKVEQRKMELEEIESGPTIEETEGGEEKDDEGDEDEETESHGVAVKVIVGIALIVVAHLVLVKKWNSLGSVPSDEKEEVDGTEEEEKEVTGDDTEPVISRRQTLVPEAADLNEYFADEVEEDEEEETGEEEEEEEEDEVSEEYSEEEVVVKDGSKWTVDYPNRMSNLSREEEEYTEEDEEELDDEEDLEDEEEFEDEEEDEDVEEDDYGWKRLEPAKMEVEEQEEEEEEVVEQPPIPPPRRSHMTSGERRGGPQGIEEFAQVNEAFEELWDNFDSTDQGEEVAPSGEKVDEEDVPDEKPEDEIYKEEFRFAEDQLDNNPTASLKKYELILSRRPESTKALIGRAKALDKIAEKERSNQYLREAINAYRILLTKHEDSLADGEFLNLSERCIDRMRFRGYFKSAIEIHKGLIKKFPANPKYRNDLAVTYLFLNDIKSARDLLRDTLKTWPKNGFALVHYGFVLKTADNNHAEAVEYLTAGIRSREPGVIDGRFFFHLGDALNRLGRGKEAIEWYDQGVKEGLFRSRYQRSLYNVDRLKGQPWWTHNETTYQDFFRKLEENWQKIRNEGLNLLNSKGLNLFKDEAENLKDTGDWRQLDLYFRGTRHSNCDRAPYTCSLIASFPSASSCTRGQVKFSVMLPSTHVWPHCGPTNCRLRSHLGLVVPKKTFIRVAEETRSWEEGKVMIFDDSFEHEVWHNGTGPRMVLIVDVWHPELTQKERSFLSPI